MCSEEKGSVGKTNAMSVVNRKDHLTSKIEAVLGLSKELLFGLFVFWAIMTGFGSVVFGWIPHSAKTENAKVRIDDLSVI